ncbi:MerC domain-containing protein [Ningiella sp. W23]|uniref:MerC domain-containing protein n=1 Tax=Ningiella sp. W23 TaxID=3023715 RepID=UPI003757F8C5
MNKLIDAGDKTAIALSFVCVLHCIALPLILIILPSVSGFLAFDDESFHIWVAFAVIPISLFAILSGYLHHRRTSVFLVSAIGMLILIGTAIFGHYIFGEKGEVIATLFGSALIAFGHLRNFRLRQTKPCPAGAEHSK